MGSSPTYDHPLHERSIGKPRLGESPGGRFFYIVMIQRPYEMFSHAHTHIMPSSSAVFCLVLGLATLYAVVRRSRNANRAPLPPGPKGLPLLGNLNDLPKPGVLEAHHWLKHKDLYGS